MQFANSAWICTFVPGELAEWSIAAVLKTVDLLKGPGVRIPSSPQNKNPARRRIFCLIYNTRRGVRVIECA